MAAVIAFAAAYLWVRSAVSIDGVDTAGRNRAAALATAMTVLLQGISAAIDAWGYKRRNHRQCAKHLAIEPLLAAVGRAADRLEELQNARAPTPLQLPQEIAAKAFLRAPSMIRAIRLLLENGLALECEPLLRSLLEMAINTMWIGKSLDHAEQFRDEGLRQARVWMDAMLKQGITFPEEARRAFDELLATGTGKQKQFHDLGVEGRAKQARLDTERLTFEGLATVYATSYRRLSGAVHSDHRAVALLANDAAPLQVLDAKDAVGSTLILIASLADCLGLSTEVDEVLCDLRAAYMTA